MTITGKLILAVLAGTLAALFILPVLATIAILGALVGLFGAAVFLWAIVLLGERWIDEGVRDYNFLDALDDALQDVFQGLRGLFVARKRLTLRERFVLALPLLKVRAAVILFWAISPIVFVVGVLADGIGETMRGFRDAGHAAAHSWTGAYL